jgi:hypothetical protein
MYFVATVVPFLLRNSKLPLTRPRRFFSAAAGGISQKLKRLEAVYVPDWLAFAAGPHVFCVIVLIDVHLRRSFALQPAVLPFGWP